MCTRACVRRWEAQFKGNKLLVEWGADFDNFDPRTQILYRTVTLNVLKVGVNSRTYAVQYTRGSPEVHSAMRRVHVWPGSRLGCGRSATGRVAHAGTDA